MKYMYPNFIFYYKSNLFLGVLVLLLALVGVLEGVSSSLFLFPDDFFDGVKGRGLLVEEG